jgi:hypothetical protein
MPDIGAVDETCPWRLSSLRNIKTEAFGKKGYIRNVVSIYFFNIYFVINPLKPSGFFTYRQV